MIPPENINPLEKVIRKVAGPLRLGHHARLLTSRFYHPVPELAKLRNIHKGKRAFIIGNGPSLNKVDLDPLAKEVTFGVNGIFLKFNEMSFKPTYYVVEDALVAEDRAPQINEIDGMTKLFHHGYRDLLKPVGKTVYTNVLYDYSEYRNFPEFSTDAARCLWVGGTVTYLNLQYAFYFGCNPVYLVGVDHSYRVEEEKNKIQGKEMTSQDDDVNHFHKDYFGKGFRWHDPNVDRMEQSYLKARKVYEAHGRHVYNATVGGHLEVFERKNYDELF